MTIPCRQTLTVLLVSFSLFNLCILLLSHQSQNYLSRPSILGQGIINQECEDNEFLDPSNELDGCYHVYLDVGSNIGNQVNCKYIL